MKVMISNIKNIVWQYYILLLCLFTFHASYSQENPTEFNDFLLEWKEFTFKQKLEWLIENPSTYYYDNSEFISLVQKEFEVLPSDSDSIVLKSLQIIYGNLYSVGYLNICDIITKRGIELSESLALPEYQISFLIKNRDILVKQEKFTEAEKYTILASELMIDNKLNAYEGLILRAKALDALNKRYYKDALSLFSEALQWYNEYGSLVEKAAVYKDIGELFIFIEDYKESEKYLLQSAALYEEENALHRLCGVYNNLGIVYDIIDSTKLAVQVYKKVIDITVRHHFIFEQAQAYYNLALLMIKQQKYNEASANIDSSYAVCKRENFEYGEMLNLLAKANIDLQKGKWQRAYIWLDSANEIYKNFEDKEVKADFLKLYSLYYENKGDFKMALQLYKEFNEFTDSISEAKRNIVSIDFQQRIEREKHEKDRAMMEHKIVVNKKSAQFAYFVLIIFVLLFFGAFWYFYQSRKSLRLARLLAVEESKNLKLSMELKDRALAAKSLKLLSSTDLKRKISKALREMKPQIDDKFKEDLDNLLLSVESDLPQNTWKEFEASFEKVHEGFYKKLNALSPELNPSETKVASFLRLKLSTKEIALITNRSTGTIRNLRSSLRSKLKLDNTENLAAYLISL